MAFAALLAVLAALTTGAQDEPSTEQLRLLFRHFDADADGFLVKHELSHLRSSLIKSSKRPKKEVRRALRALDTDGDGRLAIAEFEAGWRAELEIEAKSTVAGNSASEHGTLSEADALRASMEKLFPEQVKYTAADGTERNFPH